MFSEQGQGKNKQMFVVKSTVNFYFALSFTVQHVVLTILASVSTLSPDLDLGLPLDLLSPNLLEELVFSCLKSSILSFRLDGFPLLIP